MLRNGKELVIMLISRMKLEDINRISEINREEHVTLRYKVIGEELVPIKVDWIEARWNSEECEQRIRKWKAEIEDGGAMFGAQIDGMLVGSAILGNRIINDNMLQLVALHVSKDYRRKGIASKLMAEVCKLAKERGAEALYISANSNGPAVNFYLSQGVSASKDDVVKIGLL